ncbi:SufE family protein [Argonema antarcticum]|uniref:SufE family protein n=1 Tax=Argonema antarcticum TaxID=2942763 RepID=UPI002011B70C|nr:SufE family protein [Argonema antarcticum]MCL1469080.1 SufE family protein [Argonema antarcticum A004/B2]
MSAETAKLPASLARIVERFARQSNPKRRYEQLIWYAKRLPEFPESDKVPENKVPGCVSQVYITADINEEKVFFQGDSDSQLVKGLVALLIEGLNGLTPAEILQVSPDFIQDTGLNVSLTPSRANGFYNIFQTLKKKTMFYQNLMSAQAHN